MACRPVIGSTPQSIEASPGKWPQSWAIGQRHVRALVEAGALPWIVPLLPDDEAVLRSIYERLDGVYLPGGSDIDPNRYHETRHSLCGPIDPDRDRTELQLVRWAMAEGKPVLGVCRGCQLINVAAGGTLYQDVSAQFRAAAAHNLLGGTGRDSLRHALRVDRDTKLGRILQADQVRVNSRHHQGIKDLGEWLRPAAWAADGLIEGMERSDGPFLIGVQWHPEDLTATDPAMRRLYAAFVAAAAVEKGV